MLTPNRIQRLILGAASDDFEDLEQIYRSICLEFSPERYDPADPNAFYWREPSQRIRLEDLIDNLKALVDEGLLHVKLPDRDDPPDTAGDPSYLWHGWFGLTAAGRAARESANSEPVASREPSIMSGPPAPSTVKRAL
jgi:hypothetical protein